MATLAALRKALAEAVDRLDTMTKDPKGYALQERVCDDLEAEMRLAEKTMKRSERLARPAGGGDNPIHDINPMERTVTQVRSLDPRPRLRGFDDYLSLARKGFEFTPQTDVHFKTFGEQLQSIARYYLSHKADHDPRLVRAPTGASEMDPTGGGFLVQIDFAASVFMLAHDMGRILGQVNKLPISEKSNGIKIPGVDETSRATGSRWGGVSSTWIGEGTTVATSKPQFRMIEFDLKKLMSLMYTTDELLQDSTALAAIAGQAFAEEVMFMTEDAIVEGTGVGMPMGILNSSSRVTVAKQAGQSPATILKENVDNMWSRMWARSMQNAIWYVNQDVMPQLMQMNQAVGTGGQLVYLPPGGLSGTPYSTLYGREVVWTEYNSTVGTEGDIGLWDLSQYTLVDKNGVQAASSMHVAFNTDEMVFRITYRVDGKPMWVKPLTPFKGSNTKSPFITLASR